MEVNIDKWISVKDEKAPKDVPFLATDREEIYLLEWNDKGWYRFATTSCCCCSGHCSTNFTHWQPLPKPPKD